VSTSIAFFGGTSQILVPDNLRSGVTKACRYEPDINLAYRDSAAHYGVAMVPARSREPRDKAKVEVDVQVGERWILAVLRNRQFFSLGELNTVKSIDRPAKPTPTSRCTHQSARPRLLPLTEK
jgi:transposase